MGGGGMGGAGVKEGLGRGGAPGGSVGGGGVQVGRVGVGGGGSRCGDLGGGGDRLPLPPLAPPSNHTITINLTLTFAAS